MKKNNDILKDVYGKSLLPNILLVLGGTVNVFFDGILVGQKLGDIGLDAVNQCLPFYLILCTIGSLIAYGSVSLSAIAAGNNDIQESKRLYSVGLFLSVVASVVVCGLALIFLAPISSVLANTRTYTYVYDYLKITVISGIFRVLIYNFTFYLRLEGKLKRSSSSMLTMTVINIILDYVFLFVLDWGISGTSLASAIATFIACLMCFIFLYTDNPTYNLGFKLPKRGDYLAIASQGSSMAINNVTTSLKIFFFNQIFKLINVDNMVSIFAIISNLNEFSICIQNGVPQTGSSIIPILFGGKEFKSIKEMVILEIRYGLVISISVALIFSGCSGIIPKIFGSSINCTFAIICFSLSLIIATINCVFTYYYSGIQKIYIADIITFLRGLVLPVIILYLLKDVANYVWLLYPLTEIVCLLLVIVFTSTTNKNLSKIYLLDEEYESLGNIYSVIVEAESNAVVKAATGVNEFCEKYELSPKKTMAVNLSIEEMLMIIAEKSLSFKGLIDLRVFKHDDDIILRIRSSGKYYNPFAENDDSLDYLGVKMIEKIATKIDYQSTLGINTLIIYV